MEVAEPGSPRSSSTPHDFPSCFKCVVCGDEEHSDDGARMLPCLHHICSDGCITKARNGTTPDNPPTCPVCSITFGVEQTGRNKFSEDFPGLQNGVALKKCTIKCTFCVQGNSASTYCVDCKEFLCSQCGDYHMKMSMTMKHSYCSVEEGMIAKEKESTTNTVSPEIHCLVHSAPYALYCVECDEELCQKCSKSNHHAGHEIRPLSDCVKEFREMLSNAIPEFIAYRAKTDEAIIDLESKATNILGTERIKLLSNARSHFHKVQSLLLQRELELRTDIVKKTLYKAKELNVKRACVQSLRKQAYQYLEVIPKLLEYKDHQLFSKRQWLTKQYYRLRERVGVLLDEAKYKDYVESDWFFHIGDGVLLETIVALKALGGFIYTDGVLTQEKPKVLQPIVPVSSKPGTFERILERKYRDKHPHELTDHLFVTRKSPGNGDSLDKSCDIEMEALEASVENEYIGFDNLKKESNLNLKEKARFLSGTTLENLLDEKMEGVQHPAESDLLSKYFADKTSNDDTMDSNSEYDPVVQRARGVEKRRNTYSGSEDDGEEVTQVRKKRGRKPGQVAKQPEFPSSLPPPQPVRKSSRFEVSPRPGLALAKSRRTITGTTPVKEEVTKPLAKSANPRGRPPKSLSLSAAGGTPVPRKSVTAKRTPKTDAPPRLTKEVFLDAQEVDDILGTPTESEVETVSEDGEEGGKAKRRKYYSRRRKGGGVSDDDFEVSGTEGEDRRKIRGVGPIAKKRKEKDPFTKPRRRKSMKKKENEPSTSASSPNLAMEILFQNEKMKISNDDENEDYCTVCLDGGEDLICCDNCPKVFHIQCHMPALRRVPPEDWQCLCCVDKDDLDKYTLNPDSSAVQSIIFPTEGGMKKTDFIYACKFIADIYAKKTSLLIRSYFQKMWQLSHGGEAPLHLNSIRNRLTLIEEPYFKSLREVEEAVLEMHKQAATLFQDETTEYGSCFKEFGEHLAEIMQKYFPKEEEEKTQVEAIATTEETKVEEKTD